MTPLRTRGSQRLSWYMLLGFLGSISSELVFCEIRFVDVRWFGISVAMAFSFGGSQLIVRL